MADAPPRLPTIDELDLDEATLGQLEAELAARALRACCVRESEGVWSVVATRDGMWRPHGRPVVAHAASKSLRSALEKVFARIDAHDAREAALPRPPRVPREAADFRPTEPARGAA